jgi:hypothetical protein
MAVDEAYDNPFTAHLGKVAEYTSEVGVPHRIGSYPCSDWVMWAPNDRESQVFLWIIRVSSSVHRFQSEQKTGMCDGNNTQNPDNESTVILRLQGATIYVEVSTTEDMTFCR